MRCIAITPYKVEVVQGNFVSKEQVEALKPGMTRQQVREILGTPLLTERVPRQPLGLRVHHQAPGRRAAAAPADACSSTAKLLERFEGDPMPSEDEFVATLDTAQAQRQGAARWKPPKTSCKKFEPAKDAAAAATPPPQPLPPLPPSYPPLESARAERRARPRRPAEGRRWLTRVTDPPPSARQHRVAVAGASGRMGHMLIEAVRDADDCRLAGALDIAGSPAIGNDAAAFLGHASGVPIVGRPARRPGATPRC